MRDMSKKTITERLQRGDSAMNLFVWTLLVVMLQILIALPLLFFTISAFTSYMVHVDWAGYSPFAPFPPSYALLTDELLTALYVLLPLIVCVMVSSRMRPKRILSLAIIQTVTVVVFAFIALAGLAPIASTLPDYATFLLPFGVAFLIFLFFFGILGFFQTWLIRWWVGVNEGPLDPRTFSIGMSFSDLRAVLLEEFVKSYELHIKENTKEQLIASTRGSLRAIIAVRPKQGDPLKSVLCIVPIEHKFYEIASSNKAKQLKDDIVFNLKGRLTGKAEIEEIDADPLITSVAHSLAIEPTLTKFDITRNLWGKIPRSFKSAFVVTCLAWVVTTVLFYEQKTLAFTIEFSIYLEITVLIVLALVAEVGIPLRQELRENRVVQIESS